MTNLSSTMKAALRAIPVRLTRQGNLPADFKFSGSTLRALERRRLIVQLSGYWFRTVHGDALLRAWNRPKTPLVD